MIVSNEELRTTREVARELLSILDLVESGQKIVVTHNGKMRAVIISVEQYEALTEAAD